MPCLTASVWLQVYETAVFKRRDGDPLQFDRLGAAEVWRLPCVRALLGGDE